MSTLLAVDMSYQVYRAAAAHPNLSSRRIFTGGLYGFFSTLGKMARETRATRFAFCRDTKPYLRSEAYPEYKSFRKANADDALKEMFTESLKLIEEALEEAGLPLWGIAGFESDDLIGHCVMKYRNRYERIIAGSNDSDLWQLLWADNFCIYKKDAATMIDSRTLAKMGLTPEQHLLATALMGSHNDVEGIAGVGEKTALKIVSDPALLRTYREKHQALIERNLGLMRLPHPEFPYAASIPQHPSFDKRALYRFLGRYDIEVTGAMAATFEALEK